MGLFPKMMFVHWRVRDWSRRESGAAGPAERLCPDRGFCRGFSLFGKPERLFSASDIAAINSGNDITETHFIAFI